MRAALPFLSCAALLLACVAEEPAFDAPLVDEHVGQVGSALTVEEAVSAGCSTAQLTALNLQIIAQGNCIAPGAYYELPAKPKVQLGSAVLPFIQEPARDALVTAIDANIDKALNIQSMLRTVAQQYLLYRWYQLGQCGISLAAKPGNSNHETGLAIDISQYDSWKAILQGQGFKWLGASDPWHFDYTGPGAVDHKGVDVKAFQQLWNKNHSDDTIDDDGIYGPQTEARLKQAPAEGFAVGPDDCGEGGAGGAGGTGAGGAGGALAGDINLDAIISDANDRFDDGPSAGVVDLLEGSSYELQLDIENGDSDSSAALKLELSLPSAVVGESYALASDASNPGQFSKITPAAGNPSTSEPLDPKTTFILGTLEAGETQRLTISLLAKRYSVNELEPLSATAAIGKVNSSVQLDVYSQRRWEFDGDRLEGWGPSAGSAAGVDQGLLLLSGPAASLVASGPSLGVETTATEELFLRGRRTGGGGEAVVYLTLAEASSELRVPLPLPADGQMHELHVDLAALLAPGETLTAIRFVPFEGDSSEGTVSAAIDYLWLGRPPSPGISGANNADCSCLMVGTVDNAPSAAAWLALLGLLLVGRTRTRSACWACWASHDY